MSTCVVSYGSPPGCFVRFWLRDEAMKGDGLGTGADETNNVINIIIIVYKFPFRTLR